MFYGISCLFLKEKFYDFGSYTATGVLTESMNPSMQCCLHGLKQNWRRIHLTHLYKCTKLCSAALSQLALREENKMSPDMGRPEVVLLKKYILSLHHLPTGCTKLPNDSQFHHQLQQSVTNHQNSCSNSRTGCLIQSMDTNERLLLWEDILLNTARYIEKEKKDNSKEYLTANITDCNTNHNLHKKTQKGKLKENCLQFSARNTVHKETQNKEFLEKRSRGPSQEQLSLVLLRLREELPHFFEGRHRYSIYSKDILFVNRLTRTTTRSLKAYKFLMNTMLYTGKLFWNDMSLDILQITKHSEDNTIKVRWSAKGIPWYNMPFYVLTGRSQSSFFYSYVDGFSIFEVGRDGLVHCHRLDKVIPTSTPERQRSSLRAQILALLGLVEIERGACEAFQSDGILKKA